MSDIREKIAGMICDEAKPCDECLEVATDILKLVEEALPKESKNYSMVTFAYGWGECLSEMRRRLQ